MKFHVISHRYNVQDHLYFSAVVSRELKTTPMCQFWSNFRWVLKNPNWRLEYNLPTGDIKTMIYVVPWNKVLRFVRLVSSRLGLVTFHQCSPFDTLFITWTVGAPYTLWSITHHSSDLKRIYHWDTIKFFIVVKLRARLIRWNWCFGSPLSKEIFPCHFSLISIKVGPNS